MKKNQQMKLIKKIRDDSTGACREIRFNKPKFKQTKYTIGKHIDGCRLQLTNS